MSKIAIKRKEAKLSQQQLADMAQMSLNTLRHYEWGTRDFNKCAVGVAVKIADALGCDVKEILEDDK